MDAIEEFQSHGFTVKIIQDDTIDSCWNFYGLDYCREQAVEAAKCARKHVTETIGRQTELAI